MSTESTPRGAAYEPPLDGLLRLGDASVHWSARHDYAGLGVRAAHVPGLLRMAADPELLDAPSGDPRTWAPLHAWRALGLLRASEAAGPLVRLMGQYDDDSAREELPPVLGMIGEAAVEPVRALLADPSADLFARGAAASALEEIGRRHPPLRERVTGLLMDQLIDWPDQDEALNAFLIGYLVELGADEAMPLMEAAFEADAVDKTICGDWNEVMVDLSLVLDPSSAPPLDEAGWIPVRGPAPPARSRPAGKAAAKAKARRKAEKQSRKRNRRK